MTQGTSPHCTLATCARADLSSRSWGGRQIESGLVGGVFIGFCLSWRRFGLLWSWGFLLFEFLFVFFPLIFTIMSLPYFGQPPFSGFFRVPSSFFKLRLSLCSFFVSGRFPCLCSKVVVILSFPHLFYDCSLSSAIPRRCNVRTCQESSSRIGTLVTVSKLDGWPCHVTVAEKKACFL